MVRQAHQLWLVCKLGDVATYVTGKLNSNAAIDNGKYPFFTCSPETLSINDFAFDTEALILAGNNAEGIFSLKYFNGKFNAYQRTYIISIIDRLQTDYKFLFYSLKTQLSNLETISHGTATKFLTMPLLNSIPILLPPLPEQKAIAGVLSSLDDKIDLLHRQNKTLEGMAEALWRKMFVEDADESWVEGKLCDIVSIKYGKDHKKLLDGAIPAYGSGGVMRYVNTSLYSKESVLIPRKGSLNNVVLIDVPFWTVDTMFYTEMKIINAAKYIYYFVKSQDLASMNVGSAVPSMTTDILNNMEILIPTDESLKKFEEAVSPLFTKLKLNNDQIYSLEKHRNILLSKLMSGEVRVKI